MSEGKTTLQFAAALMGEKGGSSKSERKAHASRENGKKGGRPKRIVKEPEKPS